MSEAMQATVARINELFQQYRTYNELLPLFDHNPKIVSFNLTGELPPDATTMIMLPAQVSADGIDYPPQMIQGIKAQVQKRLQAISNELIQLGIKPEDAAAARKK